MDQPIVVLMPVRDDWVSAALLTRSLDEVVGKEIPNASLDVLMVDDGSVETWTPGQFGADFTTVRSIRVLRLFRNLGHQRAIAAGLVYIEAEMPCAAVLAMDADGEDTPAGVVDLIRAFAAHGGRKLIFAERSRRVESLRFRVFYRIYKALHLALTGVAVRVGNFSILPRGYLSNLTSMSELWNHYAASVFRSRLTFATVPIPRGRRLAGTSRMNFVSLVTHGLGAVSVFADVVGVRLLIASAAGALIALLGIVAVIVTRVFSDFAIPGWATYAAGVLSVIIMQFVSIAACFTFFVLSARTGQTFVPRKDATMFIKEIVMVYPND